MPVKFKHPSRKNKEEHQLELFEKIQDKMFKSPEECTGNSLIRQNLTPAQIKIKKRWEFGYVVLRDEPNLTDRKLKDQLTQEFGITDTQAFYDITQIKRLLGLITGVAKEWHRHSVIEMAKEAYELAKTLKNPIAMVAALDKIGKYTKLDQTEGDKMPWDDIKPPEFEPSNDISILDMEPIVDIDKKRKLLLKKYYYDNIEEANVTEE